MPWQGTLFAFNAQTVMSSGPRTAVIYALWRGERWIYIGESSNISEQLLELLKGTDETIARERPSGFGFELIAEPSQREARKNALIRELAPVCNEP